jgi:hypothetical protein
MGETFRINNRQGHAVMTVTKSQNIENYTGLKKTAENF